MKLRDLSAHFIHELHAIADENEAKVLFLMAAEHLLGYRRSDYLLHKDQVLAAEAVQQFEQVLNGLKRHQPIQHILGEAHFFGLKFNVNGSVLIPRPETEELVDWILKKTAGTGTGTAAAQRVLDIGTGSGCIAIALQKNLPASEVYAVDISPEALAIAAENARANHTRVDFILLDILKSNYLELPSDLSVVVSNPPYIRPREKEEMQPNVLQYEPHTALFVPEDDPLLFYRSIADAGANLLQKGGWLFLEINEFLAKETIELLERKGFKDIVLKTDINGKDRMICCQK